MEEKKFTFELLLDTLENLGFEVHPNYSGRGMYGKKCIGVITDNDYFTVCRITISLVDLGIDLAQIEKLFKYCATDSIGRDTILYFPTIQKL